MLLGQKSKWVFLSLGENLAKSISTPESSVEPPGRRGRGQDTEELVCQAVEVTGLGATPASAGCPQCPQCLHHSGSLSERSPWWLSILLPTCPWVAVRGSSSNAMWKCLTPLELLFARGRNLCCVLSKHKKAAEGSRQTSPSSWLWHPDLSKTSCVDLRLARLNGDDGILLQRCCFPPFII